MQPLRFHASTGTQTGMRHSFLVTKPPSSLASQAPIGRALDDLHRMKSWLEIFSSMEGRRRILDLFSHLPHPLKIGEHERARLMIYKYRKPQATPLSNKVVVVIHVIYKHEGSWCKATRHLKQCCFKLSKIKPRTCELPCRQLRGNIYVLHSKNRCGCTTLRILVFLIIVGMEVWGRALPLDE